MRTLNRLLVALLVVAASMILALPSPALAKKSKEPCPGNSCNAPGQVVSDAPDDSAGDVPDDTAGTTPDDTAGDDPEDTVGDTPDDSIVNAPGQFVRLSKGSNEFKANLKTKQHIYYEGDALEVSIKFSRGWDLLESETAAAHVVVISPDIDMITVPVERSVGGNARKFFDFVVATEALPVGQYQIALIVTIPDGDPAKLEDWYNGFRGLLDMEGIYVSEAPLPEDADADGECDFDADADGFCDDANMVDDDDDDDDPEG